MTSAEYARHKRNQRNKDPAVRAKRTAYHREWQRRNPGKVKAAQERYWLKRISKTPAGAATPGER